MIVFVATVVDVVVAAFVIVELAEEVVEAALTVENAFVVDDFLVEVDVCFVEVDVAFLVEVDVCFVVVDVVFLLLSSAPPHSRSVANSNACCAILLRATKSGSIRAAIRSLASIPSAPRDNTGKTAACTGEGPYNATRHSRIIESSARALLDLIMVMQSSFFGCADRI